MNSAGVTPSPILLTRTLARHADEAKRWTFSSSTEEAEDWLTRFAAEAARLDAAA